MNKRQINYRLQGDRKFSSTTEAEVINYAASKHKLTESQKNELAKFGTTQDGKISIIQFFSK